MVNTFSLLLLPLYILSAANTAPVSGEKEPVPVVCADTDQWNRDRREATITFSEALVERSEIYATPAPRATIRGKRTTSPQPELQWTDQDTLTVQFNGSFPAAEPWTVSLPEGTAYLSGKPVQPLEWTVHAPPVRLDAERFTSDDASCRIFIFGGQSTGTPEKEWPREGLTLSPDSPLKYTYRSKDNKKIKGIARPVYKDGDWPERHRKRLSHMPGYNDLPPGAVLPGVVCVQPEQPLDLDQEWEFTCRPLPGHRRIYANLALCSRIWPRHLSFDSLSLTYNQEDTGGSLIPAYPVLKLSMNADFRKEDIPGIFNNSLRIFIDGQEAKQADKTNTKTLVYKGKRIDFELIPSGTDIITPEIVYCENDYYKATTQTAIISHTTDTIAIRIHSSDEFPVEIRLEAGVKAVYGRTLPTDQTMASRCVPSSPHVSLRPTQAHIFASGFPHEIGVASHGMQEITLRTMRLKPDDAIRAMLLYRQHQDISENNGQQYAIYRLARLLIQKRINRTTPFAPLRQILDTAVEQAIATSKEDLQTKWNTKTAFLNAALPITMEYTRRWQPAPITAPLDLKTEIRNISLDRMQNGRPEPGMYLIDAQGEPSSFLWQSILPITTDATLAGYLLDSIRHRDRTLVQITDLDAFWLPDENNLHVVAFSLASGTVRNEARITAYGREGTVLSTGITRQGSARLAMPQPDQTAWLLVEHGSDYALIPCMEPPYDRPYERIEPDATTKPVQPQEPELKRSLMTFTDRPVYRPGETVHLKAVMRGWQQDRCLPLPPTPAVFTLYGDEQQILLQKTVSWSEFGTCDLSFNLPEEETGTCRYTFTFPEMPGIASPRNSSLFSGDADHEGHIAVEEYRRNAFEPKAELSAEPVNPKQAHIRVQALDFSGVPVAGAKTRLILKTYSSYFDPGEYTRYSFNNPNDERKETSETTTIVLSEDGTGSTDMPVRTDGVTHLFLRAEVTNDREETINNTARKTVYPSEFMTGLRAEPQFYRPGNKASLQLVCTDTNGKGWTHDERIRLTITRKEYVKTTDAAGVQKREPRTVHVLNDTVAVRAALNKPGKQGGTVYEFLPPHPGEYTITATWTDRFGNTASSRTTTQLFTESSIYRTMNHLSFHCESATVTPGQPIPLIFDHPVEGELIVFIHSLRHTASQIVTVPPGTRKIEIPMDATDEPNVEVTVLRIAPPDATGQPIISKGSCNINIEQTARKLQLSLNVPETSIRPGSETTVSGQVLEPDGTPSHAEITLYVEDEGALSIRHYHNPNPLAYFTPHHAFRPSFGFPARSCYILPGLATWNSGTRGAGNNSPFALHPLPSYYLGRKDDLLFNTYEYLLSFGGGIGDGIGSGGMGLGSEQAGGEYPRIRTDFSPCAFWKADIRTDEQGRFSATFTTPDTLTRYRVIAVAIGKGDRFGSATANYTANQELMLTAGTPFFMSTGDKLTLPVTIVNNSDKDGTWNISLHGGATQQISLKANAQTTVNFNVEATAEGTKTMQWTALPANEQGPQAASRSDAVEGSFDIIHPAPTLRETHYLVLDGSHATIDPGRLVSDELGAAARGKISFKLSASPYLHLLGDVDYLLQYPYGCVEQTASATLPWILFDLLQPLNDTARNISREQARKTMQSGIGRILSRQNKDGGFAYWQKGDVSSQWSPYALLVLRLAKETGADIPEQSLNRGYGYLRKSAYDHGSEQQALAAYVLALAGKNDNIPLRNALEHLKATSRTARLYLALALLQTPDAGTRHKAETLLGMQDADPDTGYYPAADDALLFMIAMKLRPEQAHAAFLGWRKTAAQKQHRNTWHSGWNLIALHAYDRLHRNEAKNGSIELRNLDAASRLDLGPGIIARSWKTEPGRTTVRDLGISAKHLSGSPVYAILDIEAQPENTEYPGITEKGLTVTRIYETVDTDGQWKPTDTFRVGDTVRVTLTCSKQRRACRYLAMEDCLPSCMEAVNPALSSQTVDSPSRNARNAGIGNGIDHREFLKNRVRAFVTRWDDGNTLHMSYLARVVRAGTATAPPAKAELMYEPQIYGLSPNKRITAAPR